MNEYQLRVTGMDCAECAKTIERGVARLDGVRACELNFAVGVLHVSGELPVATVVARVQALGYGVAEPAEPVASQPKPMQGLVGFARFLLGRTNTALALLGALLILPSLIFRELFPFLNVSGVWLDVSAIAALIVAGWPVALAAGRALLINREVGINLLMTVAGVGAVVIGAYTEAGLVMVLFAMGEALEGYTMARARGSIHSLMAVAPDEATVLRGCIDCQGCIGKRMDDGQIYSSGPCPFCGVEAQRMPVSALRIGETILVKPGERIAMDGRVTHGSSSVNQAPITGESMPVDKAIGMAVFAGSINGEGALEVEITHGVGDNLIRRMIALVESAQANKAPAERFVDRFARYYTPLVVLLAGLVAVLPPAVWGAPFWRTDVDQGWLYRALELLVVACPCALVISTPVALVSAISNAARRGVLVKGGAPIEALSRIQLVAFDKTGTLTQGQPSVTEVRAAACTTPERTLALAFDGCSACSEMLTLASAVEQRSEHPLAQAVVAEAVRQQLSQRAMRADGVRAQMGQGVVGRVDGHVVLIGSHRYFDQVVPHDPASCAALNALSGRGQTPILVSSDGRYLGYIALADRVRDSSANAIQALQGLGLQTAMLTGDADATAQHIAQQVGVDSVQAELLPQDKLSWIQACHQRVAMIGDGVNDAPALAAATVGIAMGAGTAQAMETADVTLMNNDLMRLPFLIRLSRATMQTIRFNVGLSLCAKLAFLALVLAGWGSLWLAVLADVGTALIVIAISMRLLRFSGEG